MLKQSSILILFCCILLACKGCEISVKNVGQRNFVWHISYAGDWDYEKELGPGEHDNYACACVPHDMQIILPEDGFYCYHYMNCINGFDYHVEVTSNAVYILVDGKTVETCIL